MILDTDRVVVPNWFDYDFFAEEFEGRVTPAVFRRYLAFVNSRDSDLADMMSEEVRRSFGDFLERNGR